MDRGGKGGSEGGGERTFILVFILLLQSTNQYQTRGKESLRQEEERENSVAPVHIFELSSRARAGWAIIP